MHNTDAAVTIDPVDPELVAAGALLRESGLIVPDPRTAPIAEVRDAQDRIGKYLADKVAPVATETDVVIPGGAGDIPARLYVPHSASPRPLLVYFHGGGFAYGSAKAWDGLMRDLVHRSGIAVLNVEYRLAPEHQFPAGLDDALAAITYAATIGEAWGIDTARLAAGGDSAGANLALVSAMSLRSRNAPVLKCLLLFYGVFSGDADSPSWRRLGTGAYGLSQVQMEWVWSTYLDRPQSRGTWRAAPLAGDVSGLPPVRQIIGSLDPLIDDAQALKARLDSAGVANDLKVYPGVNHGFVRFNRMIGQAQRAVDDAAAALRRELRVAP
jgi:acetyl esterase